jgi:hypothetical protein
MTNNTNFNKANWQTNIKRMQGMFNRFRRRYHATNNATERRFLKAEATRMVTELRQWSKKWQNYGWSNYTWITRNYTVTCFTTPTNYRRPTTCKSLTNRTYGYNKNTRTCGTRTYGRHTTNRGATRSYAARKTYTAW